MKWIIENAQWIFEGVGVAILGLLGSLFLKNKSNGEKVQKINSGSNSTNIQGGENVTVTIGEKNNE